MSKKAFFLLLLLSLSLVSCAGRSVGTAKKNVEPAPRASTLDMRMAEFLGSATEGAAATFHGTQFGSTTVVAGAGYLSALGIQCREGRVQGGSRSRIVACHDPVHGWILAPDILGDGAL